MVLTHNRVSELIGVTVDSFLWGCVEDYCFFKRFGVDEFGPPIIPDGYEHSSFNLDILSEEIKRR